jgi:hypothetical protein
LQDGIAAKFWIIQVSGQAGFFQVHDVLSAARRRPDEDHSAKHWWSIQHHLLRHHSA